MGDVIVLPVVRSLNAPDPEAPQDYDNLGPATPQMLSDMHWLAERLRIGALEVTNALCVHCKRAGIEKCRESECDIFDGT